MSVRRVVALLIGSVLAGQAQTPPTALTAPVTDPYALLAKAAPFYDFSSPDLKPWHLKASYQLYDENGKPGELGTFEYWWASPKVYRITWTRPGMAYSQWHTADDKFATRSSGKRLEFFERVLNSDLFSPLPQEPELNFMKVGLVFKTINVGKFALPCIALAPSSAQTPAGETKKFAPETMEVAATAYCFDEGSNALLLTYTHSVVTTEFANIKKVQGRYLPFDIVVMGGLQKKLKATVDEVDGIKPTDPILVPPQDSLVVDVAKVSAPEVVAQGGLRKRIMPEYPALAKTEKLQGIVVLDCVIGADGNLHDIDVIGSPSPLLTDSAIKAVSQWQYKPYSLNGQPVEVETTIHVVYSLGK